MKFFILFTLLCTNLVQASEETFKLRSPGPHTFLMTSEMVERGSNSTSYETYCQETCSHLDSNCSLGETVTRLCTQTISVPWERWLHDVEANVVITVMPLPTDVVLADEVKVKLEGESLNIKTEFSKDLILLANYKITQGAVERRLRTNKYEVTITHLPRKTVVESLNVRNLKFNKGIVTYETGVEAGLEIAHMLNVQEVKFFSSSRHWVIEDVAAGEIREVTPIPGGLRHTIDLRKALQGYRGGKLDIGVEAYANIWDGKLKMSRFINNGYNSISQRMKIKIR